MSDEPAGNTIKEIAMVCVGVALLAVLFNMSTLWEIEGRLQAWAFVRKSITKVVSSATLWAGVSFYAGYRLRKAWQAFLGGILAAIATLLVHYVVGAVVDVLTGRFVYISGSNDLLGNLNWFVVAVVLCGPLGLAGWLAAQPGRLAVLARCVLPVGAILEPFVMRRFTHPYLQIPWPERWSDVTSGVALIALGVLGLALVGWQSVRRGVSDGAALPR